MAPCPRAPERGPPLSLTGNKGCRAPATALGLGAPVTWAWFQRAAVTLGTTAQHEGGGAPKGGHLGTVSTRSASAGQVRTALQHAGGLAHAGAAAEREAWAGALSGAAQLASALGPPGHPAVAGSEPAGLGPDTWQFPVWPAEGAGTAQTCTHLAVCTHTPVPVWLMKWD